MRIQKRFKTNVGDPSLRVLAVSSAFGLGIDDAKSFTVLDCELEISKGNVVYITGDSGAGKSVLLTEILSRLPPSFWPIARRARPRSKRPLVDLLGGSTDEAIRILNATGLGDAFLYLRSFTELSDGQKYRFLLAKALDSGAQTIALDEFCSMLDRNTARVVAFLLQKVCRSHGITLIVSTAHRDLFDDLRPDVFIEKGFGSETRISYPQHAPLKQCSINQEVKVERGTMADYKFLAEFHYRGGPPRFVRHVFRASIGTTVVGVIVYTTTAPVLAGRFVALPSLRAVYAAGGMREWMKLLNKDFIRIARVVVHPTFRGIGLGVRLVRDTLPEVGAKYVETIAAMAQYNPFFEHAGMTSYDRDRPDPREKVRTRLRELLNGIGIDTMRLQSERYVVGKLHGASEDEMWSLRTLMKRCFSSAGTQHKFAFSTKHKHSKLTMETPEQIAKVLRHLPVVIGTGYYYLWKNPSPPSL